MIWKEDYSIGVEHIDKQHRELFTVINRIMRIIDGEESERSRRAAIEAIKYLKGYALNHFADEEAYQLQIGYAHYPQHKRQHEAFVGTIQELEADMAANNFSRDSISRFLGALTSWLVYHIMGSDQAIVKEPRQLRTDSGAAALMRDIVLQAGAEMFRDTLEADDLHYAGPISESAVLCVNRCVAEDGAIHVLTAMDEALALHMARTILDVAPRQVDELVRSAVGELASLLSIHFANSYAGGKGFRMEGLDGCAEPPEEGLLLSVLFRAPSGGSFVVRAWTA